jgi:hypothetical protein
MDATELFTPAVTLARAIRARELSPVEVLDAVLARIEAVNPRINAYCTVAAEPARGGLLGGGARRSVVTGGFPPAPRLQINTSATGTALTRRTAARRNCRSGRRHGCRGL